MSMTIRPLTEDDTDSSGRLGREAFGFPATDQPYRSPLIPGAHGLGLFDGTQLLARAYDREFDSWFGGVLQPTAGIAGVAVAPEARGRGLVRTLLTELLSGARERGAVLSGLFPSQPGIYRRVGYELITSLDRVRLPSAALTGIGSPDGVVLRRAEAADHQRVQALYARWAAAQNGPLGRTGPSFPGTPIDWVKSGDGISLAERDGELIGFCVWERGHDVGAEARFEVTELLATDVDGYRALLALVGSFASIAGAVSIETSGEDVIRLQLRQTDWMITDPHPYMIMIMDVAAALTSRTYPAGFAAGLDFTLDGHLFDDQDGGYRLSVRDAAATCERGDARGGPIFSPQGLVVVTSGAQSCANARSAGLLTGPDRDDLVWDALFGGRQVHIRNYY